MHVVEMSTRLVAAWSSGKSSAVTDLFAENGTFVSPDFDQAVGRSVLGEFAQNFMTGFPDLRYTTLAIDVVSPTLGVCKWRMQGTNTGQLVVDPKADPPATVTTGRPIRLDGVSVFLLSGDKIARCQDSYDLADFERQLQGA